MGAIRLKTYAKNHGFDSEREFLLDLISGGEKLQSLGMGIGFDYRAIIDALKRHNIQRQDSRVFEFCGHIDFLQNHCARLGLSIYAVKIAKTRYGFSSVDALMHGLFCQERRHERSATTI